MTKKEKGPFSRKKSDFRIDTFRAGGKGGQHQNTRDTGVRITDKETGLSAESRVHASQHANKKAAFKKLADKLTQHYMAKEQRERFAAGHHVVRTYHQPDDRVTDHATGAQYSYRVVMDKNKPETMIEERARALAGQGDE
jgi:protein subunit release factor A